MSYVKKEHFGFTEEDTRKRYNLDNQKELEQTIVPNRIDYDPMKRYSKTCECCGETFDPKSKLINNYYCDECKTSLCGHCLPKLYKELPLANCPGCGNDLIKE